MRSLCCVGIQCGHYITIHGSRRAEITAHKTPTSEISGIFQEFPYQSRQGYLDFRGESRISDVAESMSAVRWPKHDWGVANSPYSNAHAAKPRGKYQGQSKLAFKVSKLLVREFRQSAIHRHVLVMRNLPPGRGE